jgi:hypothetical protein
VKNIINMPAKESIHIYVNKFEIKDRVQYFKTITQLYTVDSHIILKNIEECPYLCQYSLFVELLWHLHQPTEGKLGSSAESTAPLGLQDGFYCPPISMASHQPALVTTNWNV